MVVISNVCCLLRSRDQRHIARAGCTSSQPRLTVVGQNDEGMTSTAIVIPAEEGIPGLTQFFGRSPRFAFALNRSVYDAEILFEGKARDERERERTQVRDRTNEFRNVAIGLKNKSETDCLRLYGQVIKRVWWMPRR